MYILWISLDKYWILRNLKQSSFVSYNIVRNKSKYLYTCKL